MKVSNFSVASVFFHAVLRRRNCTLVSPVAHIIDSIDDMMPWLISLQSESAFRGRTVSLASAEDDRCRDPAAAQHQVGERWIRVNRVAWTWMLKGCARVFYCVPSPPALDTLGNANNLTCSQIRLMVRRRFCLTKVEPISSDPLCGLDCTSSNLFWANLISLFLERDDRPCYRKLV